MTIEIWQIVALIIVAVINSVAILAAPSLAELVKYRISQPKPSPEENQPKNRSKRIGGRLKQHLKEHWLLYCSIGVNVSFLILLLLDTTPITRWTILLIAVNVALITFQINIKMTFNLTFRLLDRILAIWSTLETMTDVFDKYDQRTNKTFKQVVEVITFLATDDARETPEELAALRDKLKRLLSN